MADINRTLTLSVKGNTYSINFPNVGQIIEIESKRSELSKGQYGTMIRSGLKTSFEALLFIDIVAYLSTLCPKLLKDLNGIQSLNEIDAIDFIELQKEYTNKFLPWYEGWWELYNKTKGEDDKQGKDNV